MEIDTGALIRYDLCHRSNRENLLNTLQEIFERNEEFGESVLGGQQWERIRFEGGQNLISSDFDNFRDTKTYVSIEPRHMIDIVTVSKLSDNQIKEIEDNEPNRTQYLIGELSDAMSAIGHKIPTVAPTEYNRQTVHFYVEPKEAPPIWDGDGEIDPDLLHSFLEESREELKKYHYGIHQPQSLVDGEDLIAPHGSAFPWGKLTVFNLSAPPDSDSRFEPVWLRRHKPLREYLRTYLWLNHRVRLLSELDQETHGIERLMRNAPSSTTQLQQILEIESELDEIRETWTNRYTKTVDEIADLETRPPLQTHRGYQLERVKIKDITEGAPANSLLEIYDQQIATLREQTKSDLDRIGNKLDEVSSYIQDKINVRSTKATIGQQRATNYLTVGIAFLTVALVIIALVDLLWIS